MRPITTAGWRRYGAVSPYRRAAVATALALTLVATACSSTQPEGTAGSGSGGSGAAGSGAAESAGATGQAPPTDGPSASSPSGSDASDTGSADASSADTTTSPSHTGTAADAVNALDLQGPAFVADVPDMTPIITDAAPSLPATVTDSTGKKVTVTTADRILSFDLYGTLTDTLIGLGMADHLVGRARSDTQQILSDLPVVTEGGIDLNVEAVLNLHPDVILTNLTIGSQRSYTQLASAGVTVVQFDHLPSFDGISDTIEQVGATFGMADAAATLAHSTDTKLAAAIDTIDTLRSATPHKPRGVVVYLRGNGGIFFIFGAGYGAKDILDALGLADVATENGIDKLTPANAESLVALDPDIIITMKNGIESAGGIDAFLARPGVAATSAGQNGRVIIAKDDQVLSYGPRTPADLLAMAQAIYTTKATG